MHFLITAGPTREYIDPVRFISNASSGQMGYALAQAALKTGHDVTLISSSSMQPPIGVDFTGVESTAEMFAAVKKIFVDCDCLIMAAAVSDYTPKRVRNTKIKKTDDELVIKLKPTVDILKWAGGYKKKQIVVGFALEDKNLRKNAEKKLKDKNLDMIVANSPDAIGAEKSSVQIKAVGSKWVKLPMATKSAIAKKIISRIEKLFA